MYQKGEIQIRLDCNVGISIFIKNVIYLTPKMNVVFT